MRPGRGYGTRHITRCAFVQTRCPKEAAQGGYTALSTRVFQSMARSDMISKTNRARTTCFHSSVAQWQSIRLLTGGL